MKRVLVYCDGGLANRFGCLVGATWLATKLNASIKVYWPETNWCECPLNDLITNYDSVNADQTSLFNENAISYCITHVPFNNGITSIHPDRMLEIDFNQYDVILYNASLIPKFLIGTEEVNQILNSWDINKTILDKTISFIEDNNIDHKVYGIHIRKTDFSTQFDEDQIEEIIISNPKQKYFICSDDADAESKFKKLSNVFIFDKKNYVQKLDSNQYWNENVYRSKNAVVEAFIDLLILSRTNLYIANPISTFSMFAKLFKNKSL